MYQRFRNKKKFSESCSIANEAEKLDRYLRISTDVTLTATYPMFLAKGCFEFLLSPRVQVQEEYFHFPALVQNTKYFPVVGAKT